MTSPRRASPSGVLTLFLPLRRRGGHFLRRLVLVAIGRSVFHDVHAVNTVRLYLPEVFGSADIRSDSYASLAAGGVSRKYPHGPVVWFLVSAR